MQFETPFSSLLVYSPRGTDPKSVQSRQVCYGFKNARPDLLAKLPDFIQQHFPDLFGKDVTLVPMPRSSPLKDDALWPCQRICETLRDNGLAESVKPILKRDTAVPKSSTSAPDQRPTASIHYYSMSVEYDFFDRYPKIVLLDDVITRGATMVAGFSRLIEAFPDSEIHAFAIVRTLSDEEVNNGNVKPVHGGLITLYAGGGTYRNP